MTTDVSGRRVTLVGFGRAHRALARHLVRRGAVVRVVDQKGREELDDGGRSLLEELHLAFVGGPGYLRHIGRPDILFVTPGMPKDLPEIARARQDGAVVTGEAAYFLKVYPGPVLGITGSAGKTTTTTLVGGFLQASGLRAEVCGNIGRPFAELLDAPRPDWVVAELSSFQLELAGRSPQIAAILNFRPNHMDIHPSLEAYLQAKLNILRFQDHDDIAVLPLGDPRLEEAARAFGGRRLYFGGDEGGDGAFERDGELVVRLGGRTSVVARSNRLLLWGSHNRQNVLAAGLLAAAAGGDPGVFAPVAEAFPGVPHRLERVAEVRGILFVNDSIATAPDRTVAALRAMDRPVLLLAGGYDKGLDYAPLREAMSGVKAVLAFGKTGPKVLEVAEAAGIRSVLSKDLAEAFDRSLALAQAGDVVLLSPASASYDQFRHFEERGDAFRTLVKRFAETT